MQITPEQQGAIKRIIEEVKEKRQFRCLNIDCPCNHLIGGDDIDLAEKFIYNSDTK